MKRAASWFLCLLCPLTTVDCSRAPTAPPALSSTLISRTSFEEDTVLREKTTFDCFQTLFLTLTPVVLGGHVFDYRAVSMLRQTTQRLNVCHNCFASYPHEQWVAFRWYVGLVWGQWASAVTTWSSVLEHLSCDKKHSIIDYFQDNYSCCLFLVALVCDARRRSRDREKKKIKQIWEMFGSSAFLVVLLFGELTFAQASVSFCLLCTSNTVAP